MKKKAIEKIPFMGLQKLSRKKTVKYIGRTAVKVIGGERHLFLEVYRNIKTEKSVPAARIVMTKKDFGTWTPDDGWSRCRIVGTTWSREALIWNVDFDKRISRRGGAMEENILETEDDLKRIKKFCDGYDRKYISQWKDNNWWEYIDDREREIVTDERNRARSRKYERRQQALNERQENTPELSEKKILKYADEKIFKDRHYLYYKKRGSRADVACSKCGGVTTGIRWRPGISYESQFEKTIEEPQSGAYGTCPMCGVRGIYHPQGRAKILYERKDHIFIGQKYKETGMVIRYFDVFKNWKLEQAAGEKGPEMVGAYEKVEATEVARGYFEDGKKMQIDYHKHDPWRGGYFWDDCNLSGMGNINIQKGQIMPETWEEMKGTILQYSAMKTYQQQEEGKGNEINPIDYAERYLRTPQIEMLTKMGLTKVVRELVSCHYGIVEDVNANRVDAFFGIRKQRVKQLIEKEGDANFLKVMQMEKRMEQSWTDEQVEQLVEIGIESRQIMIAMEHMSIQKLLNHISKYAGCEYGTMCGIAIGRLIATTQTYFDYLEMRRALGYDLNNTVYLFPRNLSAAHAKMIQEHNKTEADRRLQEVAIMYPLIKKNYRRLRKAFYYEDESFLIRPARNAEEIVMEGRILHHCVGGDNYLRKHNEGTTTILFLRTVEEADVPYITVEIDPKSLHILQWYGAHDKKPDKKNMDRWLNAYITRLKCQRDGTLQEAAAEAAMPLLAYA